MVTIRISGLWAVWEEGRENQSSIPQGNRKNRKQNKKEQDLYLARGLSNRDSLSVFCFLEVGQQDQVFIEGGNTRDVVVSLEPTYASKGEELRSATLFAKRGKTGDNLHANNLHIARGKVVVHITTRFFLQTHKKRIYPSWSLMVNRQRNKIDYLHQSNLHGIRPSNQENRV